MGAAGQFRGDLFYRLNGYTIELPPLRKRDGDMIYLLEHFRKLAKIEFGKSVNRFSPESIELLKNYDWSGNVGEFHSVVRRAVLQTTGKVVIPDFLPKFGSGKAPFANVTPNAQADTTLRSEIEGLIQQKVEAGGNRSL